MNFAPEVGNERKNIDRPAASLKGSRKHSWVLQWLESNSGTELEEG